MEDDNSSPYLEPQNEQTFRLLFESIKDYAIYVMNPDGIVKTWNPGAEMMKGYRAEEILGSRSLASICPLTLKRGSHAGCCPKRHELAE